MAKPKPDSADNSPDVPLDASSPDPLPTFDAESLGALAAELAARIEAAHDEGRREAQAEADSAYQDEERAASDARRRERTGSDRLRAYAEVLDAIGEILWPGESTDGVPRRRRGVDKLVRGELELAVRDIARDVRRLASMTRDAEAE